MKLLKKEPATEVVAHDVEPLTVDTDAGAYSKFGWWIVLLGVGSFLLWAFWAPLDKGVPLTGTVAKESNRQAVQHLAGGTVDAILVREGDNVKAGQVLVRMNGVQARSQSDITRAQYFNARGAEARLRAELEGRKTITPPAALAPYKADPRVAPVMALQAQLMASRQMALQNELAAMDENIAGLKIQTQGLQESRDSKKQQLAILKEQLDNMRDLARDGYVARSRLLDVERTWVQTSGMLSEDIGNIGRAQRQVMELSLRRAQRIQDYQKEVRATLADTEREAEALGARMTALDYELANADVKAPVDGTVVGLNIFTRGGVVGPGFRMMDLVPTDDPLIVEGQLPVNLIDKVHAGLPVDLIFSAFNANKTPHIPGVVTQVSADRTVDERTGAAYYRMKAKVTPAGARLIAAQKLDIRSGMPVELFVKTGERTMMSYLLKPVFDRAKTSMSEE
ncbi:HlyD family type I secretion periplasmic adaptor subunit [Massilia sp. R2A-15]|uniref:HlyD family type I secretion periplasmic adaptor subunit n=1 Tax=Massilia sp. R2A-15 TaxID=3064278 RepID=UPI0027374609|nr:HlyD family type I secretion periplasmic adaptor subunit [Massilia sp. R2A-15]WLI90251.1 HlyD family type I secretion periplasmic adaptor subunit [Massilia sp. R2A-15]